MAVIVSIIFFIGAGCIAWALFHLISFTEDLRQENSKLSRRVSDLESGIHQVNARISLLKPNKFETWK